MNRDFTNIAATVVAVVLLGAGGPWLVSQMRSLPSGQHLAARSGQKVLTLAVNGMTCPACAARIKDQLTSTPGVAQCDVRVAQHAAYVVCDRATADSTIVNAVHRAGPGYRAWVVAD